MKVVISQSYENINVTKMSSELLNVFYCSNKSETLPVSTTKNITCVGLSPDGNLAILVDEGKTYVINIVLVV